ncbi:MAG: HAMP domain-containing histidine kinase [Micrococcales bacterium]|nr:HAMP domain-containing histidine kinase [Micrococcales bacterium]
MSTPHRATTVAPTDQTLIDTVPLMDPDDPAGSRARSVLLWLVVALPAVAGLVGAVVVLQRESPLVVLTAPLPAVIAEVGVGTSLVASLWPWRRRRARRRAFAAAQAAHAQAVARDREVHAMRMRLLLRLDHELKNPLQALRLTVASAPDDLAQALPVVAAQADRIGALLGDLRKLAELERRQLDLGPVDLAALLTEVRDDVAARPGGFQRRWSVTLPTAPWPVPTLTADPDLVYLAVRNLADNALKYSRPGDSIDLRVSEPTDGWVLVEVADTGLGIPDDEQHQVWEEFARASTSRTLPGTGMGLPLVRTVTRRHGGSTTLRSRAGWGTAVGLWLPVVPPAVPVARPGAQPNVGM